ncbi:hypothetical protein [Demequina sp. SO4-18]|uniref:hypothetical protein n=1 Tax=Demequina sp. SO4-18 TaxID=3401026 RepID=UPI003B5A7B55
MSDDDALAGPSCPVHPYGYHSRSRVKQRRAEVLVEPSLVGLPARCLALERDLEESGRVDEFVRQLWVAERDGRTGASVMLVVGAVLGALFGTLAVADSQASGWYLVGWIGAFLLAGVVIEGLLVRTHRTRLRRVYEWREYVGFHI